MTDQLLVLLIEPQAPRHRHAEALGKAGFRAVAVPAREADIARALDQHPAVIAAELDAPATTTLELAKRLRQNRNARLIPLVIYGHELRHEDVDDAARAGVLWLHVEPRDGGRLVAAVRGLVAGSRREVADDASDSADSTVPFS
jgi:DNA-binding response OmpR family regulator